MTIQRTAEEQLEAFKASVSWANDCKIQYFGKVAYAQTENLVLFPVYWDEIHSLTPWLQMPIFKAFTGHEIGLIIDGECPRMDCDRINHMLGVMGICPFWLVAKNKIYWAQWVRTISDGIDIIAEAQKMGES